VPAVANATHEAMLTREPNPALERGAPPGEAPAAVRAAACPFKVGLIYQDALSQEWARCECERVAAQAGKACVQCQLWRIARLNEPEVFARTLLEAEEADILAVAIHDAEQLPPAFYVLMDTWSRHRSRPAGAVLTLLGESKSEDVHAQRTEGFLRAIARRGDLEARQDLRELPA
jgi:hypothetical protein